MSRDASGQPTLPAGIFDEPPDPLEEHADQIDPGGRHGAHLDRGRDQPGDEVGEQVRSDAAPRADRTA